MVNNTKMSMAALAVVVGSGPSMVFAEEKAEGFIEGSGLTVLKNLLDGPPTASMDP